MIVLVVAVLMTVLSVDGQESEIVTIRPQPFPPIYLANPGMGWQIMDAANTPVLNETVAYPRRNRISWQILNPGQGVYDWSALDGLLAEAVQQGKQFSFRVYTMIGESFGGHQLPQWVLGMGAALTERGDPVYANCVYQEQWGVFVDALRERYDGNPDIAFIDISGYGNFNEWSWTDGQTVWDYKWEDAYKDGQASASTMEELDSAARRRLADMFIGGNYDAHECIDAAGNIQTTDYGYAGFQKTQLVMPYAGIRQSTQYVLTRRSDVGFRYDCLGRDESDEKIIEGLGAELDAIWRVAPIVFEFCAYRDADYLQVAENLLRAAHASIVHDNLEEEERDPALMEGLIYRAGYRMMLEEVRFPALAVVGSEATVDMKWFNDGYAPVYPRMGQDFQLRLALADAQGQPVAIFASGADVASWMPAEDAETEAIRQQISASFVVPQVAAGTYQVQVGIFDVRTGRSIQLPLFGRNLSGFYTVGTLEIR